MSGAACGNCGAGLDVADLVCPACGFPVPRRATPGNPERTVTAPPTTGPPHCDPPTTKGADVDGGPGPATATTRDDADMGPVVTAASEPGCVHLDNPPDALICLTCGEPVVAPASPASPALARPVGGAGRVVLGFPWGEHTLVPGDEVDVGREVGPFERYLEPYLTVGRRHASLRFTERGVLLVRDNDSVNGTFVDGVRCATTGAVEVADGSELRFSSAVRVLVRFDP